MVMFAKFPSRRHSYKKGRVWLSKAEMDALRFLQRMKPVVPNEEIYAVIRAFNARLGILEN
jgi:hypothetical protein